MAHVSRRMIKALGALVVAGMVAGGGRVVNAYPDKYTAGKVETIVVGPNGDFSFHLENHPQLCNSTPTGDGRDWVTVNSNYASSDGKRNLLSILTSAKLAGRSVQVRGLNNNTPKEWGCRLEAVDFL